ncbi:hypothetical protein VNO77_02670 [Canavalia gladiata]|uniref:Uncharacterized protein n=1 Tax=Canavalia gladiata TaxID=3824 RepID=A0AAN9MU65_CANGL
MIKMNSYPIAYMSDLNVLSRDLMHKKSRHFLARNRASLYNLIMAYYLKENRKKKVVMVHFDFLGVGSLGLSPN